MSEALEHAHHIQGHHAHGAEHNDSAARRVAMLVAVLAAMLAIAQMGEKSSQNAYLTHHVAVSDDWAFYQAKNVRAVMRDTEAAVLQSLPNAADPAVQARIKQAQAYAALMKDLVTSWRKEWTGEPSSLQPLPFLRQLWQLQDSTRE